MDVVPSSLRDVLLVVIVFLLVPTVINTAVLAVYVLVLRNIAVYYRFDYKMVLVQFVKTAAFNICVYQVLVAFMPRNWFYYLFVLANLIVANHLIGHKSQGQHGTNHQPHVLNAVGCFFVVVYTAYFINWMDFGSPWKQRPVTPAGAIFLIATITADIFSFNGPLVGIEEPQTGNNLNISCDALKWLDIDVDHAFEDEAAVLPLVQWQNFDTLVMSPFRLPHHLIQPIWLIITAIKAWYLQPQVYSGKEMPDNTNLNVDFDNRIILMVKITQTEVVFAMHPLVDVEEVHVNGIHWHCWLVEKDQFVVSGLTANFQYQIEVVTATNRALVMVTTLTSDDGVKIVAEGDALITLQSLALLTYAMLHQYRNQLKKLKRDENKKISDLKHHISVLRTKLDKLLATGNDLRTFNKLKGLKHQISQLEAEIEALKIRIDDIRDNQLQTALEVDMEAADIERQIAVLDVEHQQYEQRMAGHRAQLQKLKTEGEQLRQRHAKLTAKLQTRQEDVRQNMAEVKQAKRDASAKLGRKIKKINDNYDTILPRVRQATELLHQECNRVLLVGK